MKKFCIILVLVIAVAVGGWYLYTLSIQSGPIQTITPGSSTHTNLPNGSLTLAQMENASYDVSSISYFEKYPTVTLSNGQYKDTIPDPNATAVGRTYDRAISIAQASGTPLVAFGDLNNDGAGDAAVILNLSYLAHIGNPPQPSGPYTEPVLEVFLDGANGSLSQSAEPVLVGTTTDFSVPLPVDQSATVGPSLQTITGVSISSGIISLTGTINSDENSATSTTDVPATINYKLISGVLVKIGQSFFVPAQANPLGGSSWTTYINAGNHIQFDYPIGVDLSVNPADIMSIKSRVPIDPNADAVFTLPTSLYPTGGTISDVNVVFTAKPSINLDSCINNQNTSGTPVDIGVPAPNALPSAAPLDFYQISNDDGGCWAGGCLFGTVYATYANSTCYQFSLQAAVIDPGNYGGSMASVKKVEDLNLQFENQLIGLFDRIISTIQFQ